MPLLGRPNRMCRGCDEPLLAAAFCKLPQSVRKLWLGQELAEAPENGRRRKPLDPLAFGELTPGRRYVPRIAADAYASLKRRCVDVVLREEAAQRLVFQQGIEQAAE